MDLDNFKAINDTFGHAAGDEVIREMGKSLRQASENRHRRGGEEFAVVLKDASLEEGKEGGALRRP